MIDGPTPWCPLTRGLMAMWLVMAAGCHASDALDASEAGNEGGVDATIEGSALGFTLDALTKTRIGSENSMGWDSRGKASAEIDWKAGPFSKVILTVDLETTCFPFDQWTKPPAGQNWPASCDAFDRNLDVFIDDTVAPSAAEGGDDAGADAADAIALADAGSDTGASADPADADAAVQSDAPGSEVPEPAPIRASSERTPFEVIHAITPFGGPLHLEVDITDLANALPGKHRLVVNLGSYSDPDGLITGSNAGWTVSARIQVMPGKAPRQVLAAIPLFAGQVMVGDRSVPASWQVPSGTTAGRLEYRTSGHGGQMTSDPACAGPAEEFCRRAHQLFVDGAEVEDITPYRRDCAELCTVDHDGPVDAGFDYCQENPTGDIRSVRASRANWCPGSMTAPFSWDDIGALAAPGEHRFSFQIPGLVAGGMWLVSATYYAYGDPP